MLSSYSCVRRLAPAFAVLLAVATPPPAAAQELADDMVGQTRESWGLWQTAMRAVERDDAAGAAEALDKVAALGLSDLRLALMAHRTGSLRLEQMAERADAAEAIKTFVEKITAGRQQKQLADDGWHFAAIGRFDYADANFKALDESNPDPVALLELARQNPNRHRILVKLIANAGVGPSARRMIELLNEGEEALRSDAYEIALNVEKLNGTPRVVFHATEALKRSGEYAVPHLIQYLTDAKHKALHPAVIKMLPQLGRDGLNPMCVSLGMTDGVAKQVVIDSLGQIGYRQALPYLAQLAHSDSEDEAVRAGARKAIRMIGDSLDRGVSELFLELADSYYGDDDTVRADPTLDQANVWYLRDDKLVYVAVPTVIFKDVMGMRSAESALTADNNNTEAIALWLAANFRREASLGMNVESDQPDPRAANDATRPENYPRSIYFARAAGAMYNHLVLARGVRDIDPGPALGAIRALSATAGETSLVGAEEIKQPLVEALSFPNRQVRIKAAEAIGRALPTTPFAQSHNVIPVLSEALVQSGRSGALVVDPDADTRGKAVAVLRAAGFDCGVGATIHEAKSDGENQNLTSYDAIVLASDVADPDLVGSIEGLRSAFATSATPIVIVAKGAQTVLANRTSRDHVGVELLLVDVFGLGDAAEISKLVMGRIERASLSLGMSPLSKEMSLDLALRSADVLRLIAENGRTVLDFDRAVPALMKAQGNPAESLRVRSAHTLALSGLDEAQAAIAEAALNSARGQAERVATFGSLAESARRNGNLLDDELVERVIDLTMNEKDLILQAAASKALGALDLPSNKASAIIRVQSRG